MVVSLSVGGESDGGRTEVFTSFQNRPFLWDGVSRANDDFPPLAMAKILVQNMEKIFEMGSKGQTFGC